MHPTSSVPDAYFSFQIPHLAPDSYWDRIPHLVPIVQSIGSPPSQILPQLIQNILRHLFQVEHQKAIQAIRKLGIDIKADDLCIQADILP